MMSELRKIKSFTDLEAWRKGHQLVLVVYEITRLFPKDEIFGLISQMRRCVVSITCNIAEGFSRRTWREKMQFYSVACGSLTELQNQLLIARDVGYLMNAKFQAIAQLTIEVQKIVNGFRTYAFSVIPAPEPESRPINEPFLDSRLRGNDNITVKTGQTRKS